MKLRQLHTTLLLSLCALPACSDQDVLVDAPSISKTPIQLSLGGVDFQEPTTRAVITDGTDKTMQMFDKNTKIFMIMKSEYSALPAPYETLNYEGDQTTKYTVSRGDVAANTNSVVFDAKNQKYWDDAHARSSKLNIWAYAQKGMSWTECSFGEDKAGGGYQSSNPTFKTTAQIEWRTAPIYPMIFNWKASHYTGSDINKQDATTVMCQDLLFSNNLVNNSSTGTNINGTDNRLAFDPSTRKFPQEGSAEMKFYHAMSKITIKIIKGEGFSTSSSEFQFKSGTNIKLSKFNTEGLFSIQQGIFQQINAHADIPQIYKWETPATGDAYTLEALALPNIDVFMQTYDTPQHDAYSRFVKDKKDYATDVMMEFTIDDNTYQVTSGQLYDALHTRDSEGTVTGVVTYATEKTNNGNYIPLEAGKNYVFTFTIGKTKIKDITAQVAQWENVEAVPFNPTNARIKLKLEERGASVTESVDIYRAEDNPSSVSDTWESYKWTTGYVENKNVFKEINSVWKLENDWFWDNNKTYYHFRAIMPNGQSVQTDNTQNPDEDYVNLSSGVSYTDIRWGAPMRDVDNNETPDNFKFIYNKDTGFDVKNSGVDANKSQIYQAIGPTEDKLKMTLFHMMSDLTFKIKTTTGADKVILVDASVPENKVYTKVQLEGHYAGGTVLLGTGLIKTTGTATAKDRTAPAIAWNSVDGDYQVYKYGVVPQGLTDVQLRITTPDNNEYIVDLSKVLAASTTTTNIANPYTPIPEGQPNAGKYQIDRWYPGFKYTYSFTLKKTGITNLEATIVDWENVTADDETVVIQ